MGSKEIAVSIIIPCHNHARYLPRSIESSLRQDVVKEIIVVNDGSTDNTQEVAAKYPVILVTKENGGLSSARNAGIRRATHDTILPLDADDELVDGALGKILSHFDDPSDVVYGNMFVGDSRLVPNKDIKLEDFRGNNQLYSCTPYKKSVWSGIGGYWEEKELYEDWDFWGRAMKAGFKFKYVDVDLYKYHQEESGMANTLNHEREKFCKKVRDHIFE